MEKGYVYLLAEMGDNLRYKIGITKNSVEKRLKQLATGNSDKIIILNSYYSPNYKKIERMLHRQFSSDRKHLEWFTMTDEQVISFLPEAKKADDIIDFLTKNNSFFN
jgi:hypothetical protein